MRLSRLAQIKRYLASLEYTREADVVLDGGCGYGFGSDMLAKRVSRVIGVDVSPQAIAYAKKHYNSDNIIYLIGNLENQLIHSHGHYDIITLFEVLEHIDEPKNALRALRENIKDEGLLFVSVPN